MDKLRAATARSVLSSFANDWRRAGRWLRAARVAGITAAGAAIMAAMQISNPLGLTLLFNLGAPEMAFSVTTGISFLACAALLQWLALAVTGALVTWPLAHLAAFVLLSIASSYMIYALPELGRLWIWVQVPVLTDFYLIMLQPRGLSADSAEMLAGLAIAVILLVLCNRLLWARSAALSLEESTAASFDDASHRLRELLERLAGDNLGDDSPDDPERPISSHLGYHLTLLEPAIRQASTLADAAELLYRVIHAERAADQTGKLASALTTLDRQRVTATALIEIVTIGEELARLLETRARLASADHADEDRQVAKTPADRATRLAKSEPVIADVAEPLAIVAQLLMVDSAERPARGIEWPIERRRPDSVVNRFLMRFSIRHTLALTIAFLIGLWDNAPALHAALWLLMLGGPPSHGATARKFTMRVIGSAGALSLAVVATVILAPNFGTLLAYASAIFAGTLPMAYIGEGGGVLSYLAIGGTAFVIAFSGPGPRADLVGSIWTIWGISLGMIVRAVLSVLWPERSGRTLAEQFQAPLTAIVTLLADSEGFEQEEVIAETEQQLIYGIERILAVANDAKLEGKNAAIDAAELIAVADTLLRIGFLVAQIKSSLNGDTVEENSERASLERLEKTFASWLEYLRASTDSGIVERAPLRAMVLATRDVSFGQMPGASENHRGLDSLNDTQIEVTSADGRERYLEILTNDLERHITHIARESNYRQ